VTEPSRAVFLSYASQDAEVVHRICEALRAGGIEVFLDQSELRCDAWDQQIRHEIHDCRLFMPIISEHTQERLEGYFRHEWMLAGCSEVTQCSELAGDVDYLLTVQVRGMKEFADFTRTHLADDRRTRSYRSLLVLRQLKNGHELSL